MKETHKKSLNCISGVVTEIIFRLDKSIELEIMEDNKKRSTHKLLSPNLVEGRIVDLKQKHGYFQIANTEFGVGILDFILN